MKFAVEVKERVNSGNYEFIELSARVEFDEDDMGSREDVRDPGAYGLAHLDQLLAPHRRRAAELLPEDSESFLTAHHALES